MPDPARQRRPGAAPTPDDTAGPAFSRAGAAISVPIEDYGILIGRRDDAITLFERLLALRNDLGLLSEEYDPQAQRLLGNFPQAFSHTAIINTAAHLAELETASAARGNSA